MAKQMVDAIITHNGSAYTTSFKQLVNSTNLLNGNVNQVSLNTAITYLVTKSATDTTDQSGDTNTTGNTPLPTTDPSQPENNDGPMVENYKVLMPILLGPGDH